MAAAVLGGLPGARPAAAGTSVATSAEAKVTDPVPLLELRTAGHTGWFWTLSQVEAAKAQQEHGMTPLRGNLGFLRRQQFTDSHPVYRLRATKKSTYLVTASETERRALVDSGDFADEGVLGYAAEQRLPGTEMLYRMSNGAEWRVVPAARQAEFERRGYRTDGPLGYAWPTYYRTGAIYFATFDDGGNRQLIAGTKRVYGRSNDWWGGLRDFAGAGVERNAWHWPNEDFSDLQPAIGYYDDSDPETLRKQITQAAGAGLRYFSFYWYWNPANGGSENYIEGLKSFLKADNRMDIDFNVLPCFHPWRDGDVSLSLPQEQITRAANIIVDTYLTQPNYLRANDGRPILGVCDARGIGGENTTIDVAATKRFNDAVRERARQKLGEDVMIVLNGGPPAGAGFDGGQCLGQFDESRSYRAYVDTQRNFFARYGTMPLIRCATSNFDERPRIGILVPDPGPDEQKQRDSFRWYDDATLAEYERLLDTVKADITESSRPPVVDNFVMLYAWNEWHEGGFVEPNKRDGCAYLDATRRQLRLTTGSGCVANPR
ncbi:glycoside hydrolase family 99-like domain-containing protein [Amycolatopsis arida]|uniref:glycoside hydrolase family 99-like domain-containing protein n=1 Tax=Amycolatopsis arida TaxID=587909 RepID=UPI0014170DD9|nr:glycoside hydrolase family 99-like domain-containing protein [Amycolatopsis arida]